MYNVVFKLFKIKKEKKMLRLEKDICVDGLFTQTKSKHYEITDVSV